MTCFPCRRYKLDCNPRCDFLERFSQPNQAQQFEAVDFVFGFDKVRRMMQNVPQEKRKEFIQSIVVEAKHRRQDLTSGFFGIARKKVQELQSEEEKAKREISQLQGENAEALGKILLLQQEKEEAFEKIQRLLKEKEESKRATEDHILQFRQTLKEDFEKYLITIDQLFHQPATDRTTQPGLTASGERAENQNARPTTMPYRPEPILNLLDQEFAGASATEPRVGVEQPPFIWAEQDNEQQPRPPVDLSLSLAACGSPHHGVIAPAVISDQVFSGNPSADEQRPSTSSMRTNLDGSKRQRVISDEEQ